LYGIILPAFIGFDSPFYASHPELEAILLLDDPSLKYSAVLDSLKPSS